MSKIKDENYYQISGWMLNQLQLKGVALNIFAIIYGFTQDGETEFKGSLQYMCDFVGATKPTVIKAINELIEKNFITKTQCTNNGVVSNAYKVNLQVIKNFNWGSKETLQGGSKETLHNNKIDNKSIINGFNFTPPVASAILEWLEYKKQKKQSYVEKGLIKLLTKLQKDCSSFGDQFVIDSIDSSIASNYAGIFPPRQFDHSTNDSAKKNIQTQKVETKELQEGLFTFSQKQR